MLKKAGISILIIVFYALTACSPQGGQESENKKEVKGTYAEGVSGAPNNFPVPNHPVPDDPSGPAGPTSNLPIPKDVRLAVNQLQIYIDSMDKTTMGLTANSLPTLDTILTPGQKMKFKMQNKGIVDCTLGQYQAIAFNERLKVCEFAKSCGTDLGDIKEHYFDIHKLLSSSYIVLEDAAAQNQTKYCSIRSNPMGLP